MRRLGLFIVALWLFLLPAPKAQAQQFVWDEQSLTNLSSMTVMPNSYSSVRTIKVRRSSTVTPSAAFNPASTSAYGKKLYETSSPKLGSHAMSFTSSATTSALSVTRSNLSAAGMSAKPASFAFGELMGNGEDDDDDDGPAFPDPQGDDDPSNPIGDVTDYVPVGDPIMPMLICMALLMVGMIIRKLCVDKK